MGRNHSPQNSPDLRARIGELERSISEILGRLEALKVKGEADDIVQTKDIERQIQHLGAQLRAEEAKDIAAVRSSIDTTIDNRLKLTWVVAALVLLILGAIGYMAVIPTSVSAAIGNQARDEMNAVLAKAEANEAQVEAFKESAKPQPSIVLQTDYGIGGPYMPALKGVILSRDPFARIDTICTTIDAFDVLQASWYLWRACRYYPSGTVFVCITNPGGITRDQIVLKTCDGKYFVGHDNGCFDLVAEKLGVQEVYKIGSSKYVPLRINDPFGGVDVFGPIAADLAKGLPLSEVGVSLGLYVPKLTREPPEIARDHLRGTIMDIDVFGNATVDLDQTECEAAGWRIGQVTRVALGMKIVDLAVPLKLTYGHVSKGNPVALFYDGMLQLAINEGNFRNEYGVSRGDIVTIVR